MFWQSSCNLLVLFICIHSGRKHPTLHTLDDTKTILTVMEVSISSACRCGLAASQLIHFGSDRVSLMRLLTAVTLAWRSSLLDCSSTKDEFTLSSWALASLVSTCRNTQIPSQRRHRMILTWLWNKSSLNWSSKHKMSSMRMRTKRKNCFPVSYSKSLKMSTCSMKKHVGTGCNLIWHHRKCGISAGKKWDVILLVYLVHVVHKQNTSLIHSAHIIRIRITLLTPEGKFFLWKQARGVDR